MEIQRTTQITNKQEISITLNNTQTNSEFKVEEPKLTLENLLKDKKYQPYEQYINNSIKLSTHIHGTSQEDALKSVKLIIDNLDNPDFPGNNEFGSLFIPNGGPLSDELTNTLIQTHNQLGDDKFNLMMVISTSQETPPKSDDSRYFNSNGALKNDPDYPINQYNKEKFGSNNSMLDYFQKILQDLIDSAKQFGGDISEIKMIYETLISNFMKEISKSENEKNAILEHATKNNKPNPLEIQE